MRIGLWLKRLFRCRGAGPEPEIDGGVRHCVWEDAPKVIASTQITFFRCTFSTYDIPLEDSPIAGRLMTLQADPDAGYWHLRCGQQHSFSPTRVFLTRLQQLVARYDLAQYNGGHYKVSGLPPDYGMELQIRYASGESISASNNQSCFVPLEALEAMAALFENQTQTGGR